MTQLEQNLIQIKNEKDIKILPENIREGVQIFDVIGTHRGGSDVTQVFATTDYTFIQTPISSNEIYLSQNGPYIGIIAYSSKYYYYLYKLEENNNWNLLWSNSDYSGRGCCVLDYDEEYVWLGWSNSPGGDVSDRTTALILKIKLSDKTYTTLSIAANMGYEPRYSYGNGWYGGGSFGGIYKFDKTTETIARKVAWSNISNPIQIGSNIFRNSGNKLAKINKVTNEAIYNTITFSDNDKIIGGTYDGNYIFTANGKIYGLTSTLNLGECVIENNGLITTNPIYTLDDKYYFCNNAIYTLNNNTFIKVVDISGTSYNGISFCTKQNNNYWAMYKSITGQENIGFIYNTNFYSYDKYDDDISDNNVLSGHTALSKNARLVVGSMPNNGQLNYTPSTSQQIIPAGYTSGGTIQAVDNTIDSNIVPENIKKDIEILGVTGTLEAGIDTSDATATSLDIIQGKTAYVNGQKITGMYQPPTDVVIPLYRYTSYNKYNCGVYAPSKVVDNLVCLVNPSERSYHTYNGKVYVGEVTANGLQLYTGNITAYGNYYLSCYTMDANFEEGWIMCLCGSSYSGGTGSYTQYDVFVAKLDTVNKTIISTKKIISSFGTSYGGAWVFDVSSKLAYFYNWSQGSSNTLKTWYYNYDTSTLDADGYGIYTETLVSGQPPQGDTTNSFGAETIGNLIYKNFYVSFDRIYYVQNNNWNYIQTSSYPQAIMQEGRYCLMNNSIYNFNANSFTIGEKVKDLTNAEMLGNDPYAISISRGGYSPSSSRMSTFNWLFGDYYLYASNLSGPGYIMKWNSTDLKFDIIETFNSIYNTYYYGLGEFCFKVNNSYYGIYADSTGQQLIGYNVNGNDCYMMGID